MICLMEQIKESREHIYPVALKYHGQLQETYGLYDTGNRLCDTVTGAPVSVADPEILRSLLSEELTDRLLHLKERPEEIESTEIADLKPHYLSFQTVGREEQLILADVGPSCAVRLVDELRDEVEINGLHTGQEALDALRDIIRREVSPKTDLDLSGKPAVILVVGVNGVGKTTTIAKLAYLYKDLGKRVMLAAGDTFRAAASEQLETWADRAGVPLVKAGEGADPAAVIFDAVKSATARGYDMVIADTAGRLHNKKGLMDELAKISRSVKKASPDASLEVLLVLDAITGQNAISQAQEFCRAAGATGVVLTKLDGTPKGGCIIGVHEKLGLPIRFVGVGEKIDDLIFFSATDFAEALLPEVPQHKKEETEQAGEEQT